MEEMTTEMTEVAETIIVSDPETLAHIQNIETLLVYLLGAVVVIFLYGCFKFSMKFLGMFF